MRRVNFRIMNWYALQVRVKLILVHSGLFNHLAEQIRAVFFLPAPQVVNGDDSALIFHIPFPLGMAACCSFFRKVCLFENGLNLASIQGRVFPTHQQVWAKWKGTYSLKVIWLGRCFMRMR